MKYLNEKGLLNKFEEIINFNFDFFPLEKDLLSLQIEDSFK